MRFKAGIRNINTFTRIVGCLNSLGKEVWLQLTLDNLRFTVVPEQGSQVWAVVAVDSLFETYLLQSAADNVINLRVPLAHLHRALRSALGATSAEIRLTKKDDAPLLALTIITSNLTSVTALPTNTNTNNNNDPPPASANRDNGERDLSFLPDAAATDPFPSTATAPGTGPGAGSSMNHDRETTITQSIPVVVLSTASVSHLHEPVGPEPDVHILLPPLQHIKSISDRFTKLALSSSSSTTSSNNNPSSFLHPTTSSTNATSTNRLGGIDNLSFDPDADFGPNREKEIRGTSSSTTRLSIAATPTGLFRIALLTPNLKLSTTWSNLHNPELDPREIPGGEEGVARHASTRMKERAERERARGRSRRQGRGRSRGGGYRHDDDIDIDDDDMNDDEEDSGGDGDGDGEVWAEVLVEGRDWSRVLSVGRLAGSKVVCCISDGQAAILYVYPPGKGGGGTGTAEEDDMGVGAGGGVGGGSALTVS